MQGGGGREGGALWFIIALILPVKKDSHIHLMLYFYFFFFPRVQTHGSKLSSWAALALPHNPISRPAWQEEKTETEAL